jgi:fatty-acyl-CoA synthase
MYGRTFGSVLDACAASFGDATAIVHEGERFSYAQAIGDLRAFGRGLRAAGLLPDDRVAILMKDSPDLITAMYGALWAGLTIVPLNTRLALEDHVYMLRDSGARALLFDDAMAGRGSAIAQEAGPEICVRCSGDALSKAQDRGPGSPEDVDPEKPVWIQYTGGTTGLPKGSLHSHRTMLSSLLSCALEFDLRPGERCAFVAPLTHSGAGMFLPVWMRGGTNILLGGFDADQLLSTIESERVTSTLMVPTMISVLLEHPALQQFDLSTLRTVVYGAAPISRTLLESALDQLGPVLVQAYGQTEAFCQITVMTKDDHVAARERPELLASCGRPVPLCDLRVVDDELQPLPPGETGEIIVRGPHVILGYLGKPEETAKTLVDGWLRTGDIGRRDEAGFVYLVDRKSDMIITGGFNVFPKEVELVLDRHDAVAAVCVIGVPDDKWGEAIKAVVVPAREIDASELIGFVKAHKGSVAAPKTVDFVDALPLTSLGKVDKKALRQRYWADRERAVN